MKILLCVAGMPYAEAAVSFGGLIARITQSLVTLLHVAPRLPSFPPQVGGDEEEATGEKVLARAREMLVSANHLSVDTRLRHGDPTATILAEAQEGDYDLIVMGARKEVGLTQRLLGSVAQAVVRRALTSVPVVKPAKPEPRPEPCPERRSAYGRRAVEGLKRILICTGGLDVANPVIESGAQLAGTACAQATLPYVTSPTASMYAGLEVEDTLPRLLGTDTPVARHLRHGTETLARRQVAAELRLRHGIVADEILCETRRGNYGLVVIGTSGAAGRLRAWLLGNVTRQVVEHASCSVLVVK